MKDTVVGMLFYLGYCSLMLLVITYWRVLLIPLLGLALITVFIQIFREKKSGGKGVREIDSRRRPEDYSGLGGM